jgi:hypothetical protein
MRTDCIVKLSKLQISELNTVVQKLTSGHVEGQPPLSDGYRSLLARVTALIPCLRVHFCHCLVFGTTVRYYRC